LHKLGVTAYINPFSIPPSIQYSSPAITQVQAWLQ